LYRVQFTCHQTFLWFYLRPFCADGRAFRYAHCVPVVSMTIVAGSFFALKPNLVHP
jgi:hypothetical protein